MIHISGIACSVFQREIEKMRNQGKLMIPFRYLDSSMHIYPTELRLRLDDAISDERAKGNKVILVYGDCHAYMSEYTLDKGIVRIKGMNCGEIFLGSDLYRKLRRQGAFIFFPEWTARWKEIFTRHLGFTRENIRSFMEEMHSKLIYVNTHISLVPYGTLDEISDFTGLRMEVITVSPNQNLLSLIHEAKDRISGNE